MRDRRTRGEWHQRNQEKEEQLIVFKAMSSHKLGKDLGRLADSLSVKYNIAKCSLESLCWRCMGKDCPQKRLLLAGMKNSSGSSLKKFTTAQCYTKATGRQVEFLTGSLCLCLGPPLSVVDQRVKVESASGFSQQRPSPLVAPPSPSQTVNLLTYPQHGALHCEYRGTHVC